MDYLTSTIHDYQPIFVGAGCLALGYMYGKHCRSLLENQIDVSMPSEATCCVQTESCNYISDHVAVDKETMAVMHPLIYSNESALSYSEREFAEKSKKCSKRDLAKLEIFNPYNIHWMPRKKEDMIRAQTTFKKQKGASTKREVVYTKVDSEQDSDDEILARRLEFFAKSVFGTQASINLKQKNKEKSTLDVMTNCEAKIVKDYTTTNLQNTILSKGGTKSLSGLGALATPHDQYHSECSLENTYQLPKKCLKCGGGDDFVGEQDKYDCNVELSNFLAQFENATIFASCSKSTTFVCVKCTLSEFLEEPSKELVEEPLEEHVEEPLEEDLRNDKSMGSIDSQCNLHKHDIKLGHNMVKKETKKILDARMEDVLADDINALQNWRKKKRLGLPTSPPPELYDMCMVENLQEVKQVKEYEVPTDKVLKAEIYEVLHATNCGKVSFEEIVSLLEEKLKVVLWKDKAHIVALVREVISFSKILEDKKTLEASGQAHSTTYNETCCS